MRVAIYIRVSTTKQAVDGHGLDAQRHRLAEVVEQRDLTVVEMVADEGVTGSTLDRPGFQRVMQLAHDGQIDGVLVTKADRVSRSARDYLNLVAEMDRLGIALLTADEQFQTDGSPLSSALSAMRAVFAQLERDMARARTRDGMAAARAKGVRLGGPPVGWSIDAGMWAPTPRHVVVRRAHALRADGLTIREVAAQLEAEGIPTGSGRGRWSTSAVRRLLASPLTAPVAMAA